MNQPPLGGCVLKRWNLDNIPRYQPPAAFRRLCVETARLEAKNKPKNQPPLGGCVLKPSYLSWRYPLNDQPPLGGCVLKRWNLDNIPRYQPPAAFRRLCVETARLEAKNKPKNQPPLGGCVLKRR